MLCSKCNTENLPDAVFCNQCGARIEALCPSCGIGNPAGSKFCRRCGSELSIPDARPKADSLLSQVTATHVADSADGERKTVTALFADIKGSLELMEDLDPEEARAIIDPALKLMIEAVRRYDGHIVQSTGDGIFALFGAPVGSEDHPQRALYAALRMQDEMRRYSTQLREAGNQPIEARVGIDTGEVVVRSLRTGDGHTEYTPIGLSTSLAARMQALAPVGSIAVTETTERFCAGYFSFKPLGPTRVKGLTEAVNVFEVTGLGSLRTRLQRANSRGFTRFVGREREVEALRHAAELACAGHGQVVAVMADPGVGKSRLLHEFKLISQSNWTILQAFSVSYGKASSYLPVIELLKDYLEIGPGDDERKRREKVNGKIVTLDRSLEDTLPYLLTLLSLNSGNDPLAQMDAQIKRRRTHEALKRILLRESLDRPLMLIFEDLHWIDAETQGLLNALVDSIANARILLLVNYRPEYSHKWHSKTYYTQLRLDPLGKESADEMLTALLGDGKDLLPLRRLIIERTEGNPFFMEEIVQVLLDEGALVRDGEVKLTQLLNSIRVPATVQAMLAARIDRLPPADKDLLQTLAVLGKEFTLGQLKTIAMGNDSELDQCLAHLQSAEFIYEQPTVGDVEYTFKHALTQEVAYSSILIERRKQIHESVARAIESIFAANLTDHYDELAHHFVRSGNSLRAVNYLGLAAQQAMTRSAYTEAVSQLNTALELLRRQPHCAQRYQAEIKMMLSLATATTLGSSFGLGAEAVIDILEPACELCRRIGDEASLFEALEPLARQYSIRDENQRTREIGEELVRLSIKLNQEPGLVARALTCRGYAPFFDGDLIRASQDLEHANTSAMSNSGQRPNVVQSRLENQGFMALTLCLLGYPERAQVISDQTLAIARRSIDSPADLALVLFCSTLLNLLLRDWTRACSQAHEATALADKHGLVSFASFSDFILGCALANLGQGEKGFAELSRSQTNPLPAGPKYWFLYGVATAYLSAHRRHDGLAAIEELLRIIGRTGTRFNEAEARRLKGELLLLDDDASTIEAAECFRDAISIAGRQGAKSWELRATTSLARQLDKQGRRQEARTMLAEIYNWFTEGFDTADLKDAKALLDELSV
jgi:class 3 adenylate cyclase